MDKKNSLKEKKRKLNKTHSVVVTCENESSQINDLFDDMEKSVKVMESYVMGFFTEQVDVEDRNLQEKIINSADQMFADVAKHPSGADVP